MGTFIKSSKNFKVKNDGKAKIVKNWKFNNEEKLLKMKIQNLRKI
jgi:hypothetical protein